MTNLYRIAAVICLWGCFQTHPAWACQYNVRETGFADLGFGLYYFYGFIRDKTPEDIASIFRQISYDSFRESNIKVEIINVDRQKAHPAKKYLDLWQIQSFPSAVLVSPDGQSLVVPLRKTYKSFKQMLQSAINDIVTSPTRDKILKQVIKTYGVILLIEGTDAEENIRAREAVFSAIEKIKMQMKLMPKTIPHPPALIVMSPESLPQEKILLWSLGLDADKISIPYAVVLYGRARWIGPLLKGKELNETVLAEILYVIGEDCECGFDWRLLQGTMLPTRWDDKTQARVAKALGFDPENPMIKMEISQILRRGSSLYPGVPFRYQNMDKRPNTVNNPFRLPGKKLALQKPLFLIGGLVALIIIVSVFIFLRAARKTP